MALATWDPFREMDDFFGRYFQLRPQSRGSWLPAMDVDEDEKAFHLALEVPGMNKDQVKVAVENGMLVISGERSREDKGKSHRVERSYGSFTRSFTLPDNVDPQGIEARFDNGLLILALPKTRFKHEPLRIEVQ
ncbi:Hsp20/alpha crystallin family protein [Gallaecimonas kandeliae]|uniref:Hsp20/alpha crystallin family protein n=1 Tax=Gallaecimonas kandeliae TaxID=3029055 RepID=UPI0026472E7B|nr:Hsp20/alpha crystallin family protein [Gallaecimonas kandeliae]WKE66815.1 Hsp20/alpha crystallin family protein [Gallaecimonas kandeliae]